MKKLSLLVAAAAGLAGLSSAQNMPISFALRGGGALAQDSELQAAENTWASAGLDIGLGASGLFPDATSYISFDWLRRSGKSDNVYILCFNQRFYGGMTSNADQRIYLIGGLGMAKFDIGSVDDNVVAGRAGVGMEFTKFFYGEAILNLSAKGDGGFRTNSFCFYFGFKL
ncbi:MAG: hypothetical protein HZC36_00565 [Armatimonadetes bacterium]|nr:hypothetical protein [Armatimonadota bacterium]